MAFKEKKNNCAFFHFNLHQIYPDLIPHYFSLYVFIIVRRFLFINTNNIYLSCIRYCYQNNLQLHSFEEVSYIVA